MFSVWFIQFYFTFSVTFVPSSQLAVPASAWGIFSCSLNQATQTIKQRPPVAITPPVTLRRQPWNLAEMDSRTNPHQKTIREGTSIDTHHSFFLLHRACSLRPLQCAWTTRDGAEPPEIAHEHPWLSIGKSCRGNFPGNVPSLFAQRWRWKSSGNTQKNDQLKGFSSTLPQPGTGLQDANARAICQKVMKSKSSFCFA